MLNFTLRAWAYFLKAAPVWTGGLHCPLHIGDWGSNPGCLPAVEVLLTLTLPAFVSVNTDSGKAVSMDGVKDNKLPWGRWKWAFINPDQLSEQVRSEENSCRNMVCRVGTLLWGWAAVYEPGQELWHFTAAAGWTEVSVLCCSSACDTDRTVDCSWPALRKHSLAMTQRSWELLATVDGQSYVM